MRSVQRFLLSGSLIAFGFAWSQSAIAHPGHGVIPVAPESAAHYAFEPIHVLPAIAAGLLLVAGLRWIRCRRWLYRHER